MQLWPGTQVRSSKASQINVAGSAGRVDGFVLNPGDYRGRQLQFNLLRDFRVAVTVQVRAALAARRRARMRTCSPVPQPAWRQRQVTPHPSPWLPCQGGVRNAEIIVMYFVRKYEIARGDGIVFRPAGAWHAAGRAGQHSERASERAHVRALHPAAAAAAAGAGGTISNVTLSHFSVCQSLGSCVVLEGPGTLQDVVARGNFMVHGVDPGGWANHPAFAALRIRGSRAPTLNNTQVIFQVRVATGGAGAGLGIAGAGRRCPALCR